MATATNELSPLMTFSKVLEQERRQFQRLSRDVAEKCTQKNIHELRILSRKLRAALWLARHGYNVPPPKELRRQLHDLGDILGKNRQMDVLCNDAKKYGYLKKDHGYTPLRSSLRKCRARLTKSLSADFRKAIQFDLQKMERSLRHKKTLDKSALISLVTSGQENWPSKLPKNKTKLHRIRIQTKKMIYRMGHFGIDDPPLKDLQKRLGRIHDMEVLQKNFGKSRQVEKDIAKCMEKAEVSYAAALKFDYRTHPKSAKAARSRR